jgi:hypothetical protein
MRWPARAALVVTAAIIPGAGGCRDASIASLEATRDRVCECKDADCVDAAMEQLQDLPTKKPRKAEAIAREITDCVARIYQETDARAEDDTDPTPRDAATAP